MDFLRIWSTCKNRRCRRARRCCGDVGVCWNKRYSYNQEARPRLREKLKAGREKLPAAIKNLARRIDPSDALV
jgi:hypothetical protein